MGDPLVARQELAQIEHDFQVVDDVVSRWEPKLFGVVPVPWVPSRDITVTEGKLLDRLTLGKGYFGLTKFRDISEDALEEAKRQFPPPKAPPDAVILEIAKLPLAKQTETRQAWGTNDGHCDAFRHTYWNARLTIAFGEEWTRAFTTAHEGLVGNQAVREAMDLFNNSVGRKIGMANLQAGAAVVARAVRKAVDDGDVVVVALNGHLAWSDQVAFGQHGIAAPGSTIGVLATPGVVSVW